MIVSATGLPWARAMLPNSDQLTRVGLSPAIGFAALGLGSIAVDATGLRLSGTGGLVAAGLAFASGIAVAGVTWRRGHSMNALRQEDHPPD